MSLFHQLHGGLLSVLPTGIDVPQPAPDYSGPGTGATRKLAGQVLGWGITAAVVVGVIGGIMIVAGFMNASKKLLILGFGTLGCVVAGVIVMLNVAGIINWGGGFNLFG